MAAISSQASSQLRDARNVLDSTRRAHGAPVGRKWGTRTEQPGGWVSADKYDDSDDRKRKGSGAQGRRGGERGAQEQRDLGKDEEEEDSDEDEIPMPRRKSRRIIEDSEEMGAFQIFVPRFSLFCIRNHTPLIPRVFANFGKSGPPSLRDEKSVGGYEVFFENPRCGHLFEPGSVRSQNAWNQNEQSLSCCAYI